MKPSKEVNGWFRRCTSQSGIINRGDRWIDSMRSRQSEVDYESSVYKRFGYEMDEAKRMQEEYAQRQLVEGG